MRTGAKIAIMGPNFKYCAREYFDCADHTLALTHLAVEEHLYAANLLPVYTNPKYLPYSFRGVASAVSGPDGPLPQAQTSPRPAREAVPCHRTEGSDRG